MAVCSAGSNKQIRSMTDDRSLMTCTIPISFPRFFHDKANSKLQVFHSHVLDAITLNIVNRITSHNLKVGDNSPDPWRDFDLCVTFL